MNINKVTHTLEQSIESIDLACELLEMLIKNKRLDVDLAEHKGFIAFLESIDYNLNEKIPSIIENS